MPSELQKLSAHELAVELEQATSRVNQQVDLEAEVGQDFDDQKNLDELEEAADGE
jgi:hypothetical protein